MAEKEKVETLSLEEAALAKAKEEAIREAVNRKAMDYAQKIQIFLAYEGDARAARANADALKDELEITNEEVAQLFPSL